MNADETKRTEEFIADDSEAEMTQPHPGEFPQRGWISVKERVPGFHRQVLSFDGKRQWVDYIESVSESRWHTRRAITHWRELPEPPVEQAP